MLIDTHCHLASRQFAADADEVIARAVASGVGRIIVPATSLDDAPRALALAEQHAEVYVAVGIHPGEANETRAPDWIERIAAWAGHPKVVAIGECGLDYHHPPPAGLSAAADRARQVDVFRAQLTLAAERSLPVVVHHRGEGCWADVVAMVAEFSGRVRAQFHCFGGSWTEAAPVVENGHLISFTGVVTYKNGAAVADCARAAGVGSFMLETDAPYLAPVPHRGKRCEPGMVRTTAEFIAGLRGIDLPALAAATTRTAGDFFGRLGLD